MKAWSGCFPVDRLAHPKPLQFLALICYVRHSCTAWDPGLGLDPQGCKPVHVSASLVSACKKSSGCNQSQIADFTTEKTKLQVD